VTRFRTLLALAAMLSLLVGGQSPSRAEEGSMDVTLEVQALPQQATAGEDVTYTITITNNGPDSGEVDLASVLDGDAVPTPVQTGPDEVSCQGSYSCQTGTLAPGESVSFEVVAAPISAGQLHNQLVATASLSDPTPGDNTSLITTDVAGPDCTLVGTPDDDVRDGNSGDDVLCGLGGADTLSGHGGDDILRGGSGADVLDGGTGDDQLDGGTQVDTASFASSTEPITAELGAGTALGAGTDTMLAVEAVRGSDLGDTLTASVPDGTLDGGAGTDLLFAGTAAARLLGGADDDYLHGGPATDQLDGGTGTNTCVWAEADVVTACTSTDPSDGNDVRGRTDLKGVNSTLDPSNPSWSFGNLRLTTPQRLWDRGFFTVNLDTSGGPEADYVAVARATRRAYKGVLITAGGSTIRRLTARRTSPKTVTLWVPLPSGSRDHYRWWVVSMYVGKGCRRNCLDRIPNQGAMIEPR
jgi:uncharacterized repeat protein (TIGR01451 family)